MRDSEIVKERNVKIAFRFLALVLGLIQAWSTRHAMNPDGISYLDIGDAYMRGDWQGAINAYWSPLYSWLLGLAMIVFKPSAYWEFPLVHLLNFMIYAGALLSFEFFLRQFLQHRRENTSPSERGDAACPEWICLALSYTLFIWSSLVLIGIDVVTPDMCVAAIVYLASGLILRIRRGFGTWAAFIILGAVLGFGYLIKAPLFLLSFIFIGLAAFSFGNLRKALPRSLTALFVFFMIAAPWIAAISQSKGRLTFGDSAKLNYAWVLNG